MKKLLTTFILCSILFLGCGKAPLVPDGDPLIPPLPALDAEHNIIKLLKAGAFSCMGSDEVAGKSIHFSYEKPDRTIINMYSMWVFNSYDSIVVEYDKDLKPGRTWIDLDNDRKPEYFANSPTEFKDYPDICKTLDYFRNLNGRSPRETKLGTTSI